MLKILYFSMHFPCYLNIIRRKKNWLYQKVTLKSEAISKCCCLFKRTFFCNILQLHERFAKFAKYLPVQKIAILRHFVTRGLFFYRVAKLIILYSFTTRKYFSFIYGTIMYKVIYAIDPLGHGRISGYYFHTWCPYVRPKNKNTLSCMKI